MAKRDVRTKPFWRFIFVVYSGLMIWLLFFRDRNLTEGLAYSEALKKNMNLKLFYTIDNYIHVIVHHPDSSYFTKCVVELFGNVLMFIPAGWLLPKVFPSMRKFFVFLISCIGIIFFIEAFQLFTLLGYFDVDDIILNIVGMFLGYILFFITSKK